MATAAAQAALADGVVDGIAGVVDADGTARQRLASALDAPGYAAVADSPWPAKGTGPSSSWGRWWTPWRR